MNDYTVIDLEMTGLSAKTDKIIEIGAVKVRDGAVVDTYWTLVNPKRPLTEKIMDLTGITNEMLAQAKEEDEAMEEFLAFLGTDILVGHNIGFDYSFMKQWAINKRRPLEVRACDTLKLARALLPAEQKKTLEQLCVYFAISRENAHRALDDAGETQLVYECLKKMAGEKQKELFTAKTLQYKAKRTTPATKHQIERLKEFREKHHITEELCFEALTRSEASRLQDKYYATYGRN